MFSHSYLPPLRDNNPEIDRKGDNCDRLWKIPTIFDTLSDAYENFYNPSDHSVAEEINVKFKERV
jgi:hypothetical protein